MTRATVSMHWTWAEAFEFASLYARRCPGRRYSVHKGSKAWYVMGVRR